MMTDSAIRSMVEQRAPRLFAVVEDEGGEARVEAWGMVLGEHTEVVSAAGDYRMSLDEPDSALWVFTAANDTARLVWV